MAASDTVCPTFIVMFPGLIAMDRRTIPVPFRFATIGAGRESETTVTFPDSGPGTVGEKVMVMAQLAPGASAAGETGQLLVWTKPAVVTTLFRTTEVLLTFARVKISPALVLPTITPPKFRAPGEKMRILGEAITGTQYPAIAASEQIAKILSCAI